MLCVCFFPFSLVFFFQVIYIIVCLHVLSSNTLSAFFGFILCWETKEPDQLYRAKESNQHDCYYTAWNGLVFTALFLVWYPSFRMLSIMADTSAEMEIGACKQHPN